MGAAVMWNYVSLNSPNNTRSLALRHIMLIFKYCFYVCYCSLLHSSGSVTSPSCLCWLFVFSLLNRSSQIKRTIPFWVQVSTLLLFLLLLALNKHSVSQIVTGAESVPLLNAPLKKFVFKLLVYLRVGLTSAHPFRFSCVHKHENAGSGTSSCLLRRRG